LQVQFLLLLEVIFSKLELSYNSHTFKPVTTVILKLRLNYNWQSRFVLKDIHMYDYCSWKDLGVMIVSPKLYPECKRRTIKNIQSFIVVDTNTHYMHSVLVQLSVSSRVSCVRSITTKRDCVYTSNYTITVMHIIPLPEIFKWGQMRVILLHFSIVLCYN
jgi:hypothetical protein